MVSWLAAGFLVVLNSAFVRFYGGLPGSDGPFTKAQYEEMYERMDRNLPNIPLLNQPVRALSPRGAFALAQSSR